MRRGALNADDRLRNPRRVVHAGRRLDDRLLRRHEAAAEHARSRPASLRRQFTAPSFGSERVFACIVAGTTANTTDATWTTTKGAKTTDGTATWIEVTGQPGVNGDTSSATARSGSRA